jgi:hypothetical protein
MLRIRQFFISTTMASRRDFMLMGLAGLASGCGGGFASSRRQVMSVSNSVTSLLIGPALRDGRLAFPLRITPGSVPNGTRIGKILSNQ